MLSPAFYAAAGEAAVGLEITAMDVSPSALGKDYPELYRRHVETYGEKPRQNYHAYAYDAAQILLPVIETVAVAEAGNIYIGRRALRDALFATGRRHGMSGPIECNEHGDCGAGRPVDDRAGRGAFVNCGSIPERQAPYGGGSHVGRSCILMLAAVERQDENSGGGGGGPALAACFRLPACLPASPGWRGRREPMYASLARQASHIYNGRKSCDVIRHVGGAIETGHSWIGCCAHRAAAVCRRRGGYRRRHAGRAAHRQRRILSAVQLH